LQEEEEEEEEETKKKEMKSNGSNGFDRRTDWEDVNVLRAIVRHQGTKEMIIRRRTEDYDGLKMIFNSRLSNSRVCCYCYCCVDFDDDVKRVVWTGCEDGGINRWIINTDRGNQRTKNVMGDDLLVKQTHEMRGHSSEILKMYAIATQNRIVSVSRDSVICSWNTKTMICEERVILEDCARVLDAVVMEMEDLLGSIALAVVVCTLDQGVLVYDALTLKRVAKIHAIHDKRFDKVNEQKREQDECYYYRDALVVNLKLGAPEGIKCDEILATFDDGEVKLINVREEIEKLRKSKNAKLSLSNAAVVDDDDNKSSNTMNFQPSFVDFAGFAENPSMGKRRFQNIATTSNDNNAREKEKEDDDAEAATEEEDELVAADSVSSQSYLTKKIRKTRSLIVNTTNNNSKDNDSNRNKNKNGVGFTLVAFGLANGIVEVHSLEEEEEEEEVENEKKAPTSCSSNSNQKHKGPVRCIAQIDVPVAKNTTTTMASGDDYNFILFATGGEDCATKIWKFEEEKKNQRRYSIELVAQSRHHISPTIAILPLAAPNSSKEGKVVRFMTVSKNGDVAILGVAVEEDATIVLHSNEEDDHDDDNDGHGANNDEDNNNKTKFRIAECKIFSRFEPDDEHSKLTRGVCEIILDEKMHLLRILYASGSVKIWDMIGEEKLERELFSSVASLEMWKQSRPSGAPEFRFAGGGKFWRILVGKESGAPSLLKKSSSITVAASNVSNWLYVDSAPLSLPNSPIVLNLANLGKFVSTAAQQKKSISSAISVASRATNFLTPRKKNKNLLTFSKVRIGHNNNATTLYILDSGDDTTIDEETTSYGDFVEAVFARAAVEAVSLNSAEEKIRNIEKMILQKGDDEDVQQQQQHEYKKNLTELQARRFFFRCVSLWSSETPCVREAARNIAKVVLDRAGIVETLRLPPPPEADEDERDEEESGGDLFDKALKKQQQQRDGASIVASFWSAFFIRKEDKAILPTTTSFITKKKIGADDYDDAQEGVFGLLACAVGLLSLSSEILLGDKRITDAWKGAATSHLLKFVARASDFGGDDSLHASLALCVLRCGIYGDDTEEKDTNDDDDDDYNINKNNEWFSCVRDPNRCLEDAFKVSSFEVLTSLAYASPSFYVAHVMKRFREIPADSPLHSTSIDALTEAVLRSSSRRRTFEPHVVAIAEMLSLCVSSNISGTLGSGIITNVQTDITLAIQPTFSANQTPPTPSVLRKTCKRSVISLALMLGKRCRNVAFHEPTKRLAVGLHGAVKGGSLLSVYDLSVGQKWRTLEDDTVDNAADKFASSAASGAAGVVEALAKETLGLGFSDLQRQSPAKSTNNLKNAGQELQRQRLRASKGKICSTLGAVAFDDEGHQVAAYLHERCFVYVWNVNPSWRHAFARGVVPLGTSQRMPCVPIDDLDNVSSNVVVATSDSNNNNNNNNNSSKLRWKNANELRLQHGRLDMVYRLGD
jgi:hypothetical protein